MALYINGEEIDQKVIEAEAERLRPHYEEVFATDDEKEKQDYEKQLMEWSRENVIERVVLRQVAMKEAEGVDDELIDQRYDQIVEQGGGEEEFLKSHDLKPEDVSRVKGDIEKDLKVQAMLQKITEAAAKPTKKEVRKYYEENQDQFTIPEMVKASHIVKHFEPEADQQEVRKELEDVLKEIKEKDNFAEMAGKYSSCPENGGDLGFFPRGQMVPEFEEVVFSMEPGEVSEVFETQFGLHIAKVIEKADAIPCKLEDVTEVIEKELLEQAQQKEIEKFVDTEKEKAVIEDK